MTVGKTVCLKQACEVTGVSRRTIYSWMRDGKVQYVRTAGGSVRILSDSLFRNGNVPAQKETDQ